MTILSCGRSRIFTEIHKIIQKTMEFEKVDKTAKLVTEYLRRYTVQTIFNAKIIQKTME
jgi:hypothetical protein